MNKVGMITSPYNGQPVLVIVQETPSGKVWMDRGQPLGKPRSQNKKFSTLRKMTLRGKVGDVFNYATLRNYGKRDIIPIP